MTEAFDGDWLDLREPYDAASRDFGLAVRLAAALPARPRILDLGAGTGSLLRWLGHFIGRAQAWTLVDADPELAERAFETIADRAEAVGWAATWPGKKTLLVHSPEGAWRIEGLIADLAEAPGNLPLDKVDAVVCSALCDLVSRGWIERIAAACAARRLPFYAALNVTGNERFAPPRRGDAVVMRGFRRDQRRDKGFGGIALGPAAPDAIAEAFAAQGYTVHRAPSDWVIDRRAGAITEAIAVGHATAALAWERRSGAAIEDWLAARRSQAVNRALSIRIGHQDILALPPER
ncbi:class I SAM-dependent methyltransferase [Neoroseomonas oryzicola]|uniref:Class I SAM-dependent methyltransferase n=1 Tax=Neoroseomonas oryzicola TaxID=535904 RepID=A0A9X9WD49_9PROT|nr:class I SAM-dependent methyltransferase [Neoroseomonas oryzicola]MBR0658259.1 class I SAM-dependent methyltransferase [Neoroseomonas oryzicola]NKE15924.1 class I SAM-dependent methyltransferase [Neoroseomonas oryzicola]